MSESHGQSTASWTGTGIILLGCLAISLGVVFKWSWLWIAGAIITVAGVAAWIMLERAGHGSSGEKSATRG